MPILHPTGCLLWGLLCNLFERLPAVRQALSQRPAGIYRALQR